MATSLVAILRFFGSHQACLSGTMPFQTPTLFLPSGPRSLAAKYCAMAWLVAQGFLVPAADSGVTGWMVLSRRARSFESENDFRHFSVARRLNRELLHPMIAEKVWLSFVRGNFAEAVFTAMRAVEIVVREAGGLEQKLVGTKLMQAAFGQGGPLRDAGADASEEDGLMHLFIGAMGSFKYPHSHRNVPLDDAVEAIEIVTFASHLLRIVDSRRSNFLGPQER